MAQDQIKESEIKRNRIAMPFDVFPMVEGIISGIPMDQDTQSPTMGLKKASEPRQVFFLKVDFKGGKWMWPQWSFIQFRQKSELPRKVGGNRRMNLHCDGFLFQRIIDVRMKVHGPILHQAGVGDGFALAGFFFEGLALAGAFLAGAFFCAVFFTGAGVGVALAAGFAGAEGAVSGFFWTTGAGERGTFKLEGFEAVVFAGATTGAVGAGAAMG
jgi:hypothetical protein